MYPLAGFWRCCLERAGHHAQTWVVSFSVVLNLTVGTTPLRAQDVPVAPEAPPGWVDLLQAELALIALRHPTVEVGVYVRDLESGFEVSQRGDERWYLASTVKVPVALAVLRAVERGDFTLDTRLRIRASDYVDGAGSTKSKPVGTPLSVRHLMEQMLIYSDNTASDMLIGLVGIDAVNELVAQLVPRGLERITTLADVRRHAYGYLTSEAAHLTGRDFFVLKQQRNDAGRLWTLANLLGTPATAFELPSVGAAFDAYYASGLNSGSLQAYADLLQQVVNGHVLNATHTRYLVRVMEGAQTGQQRIKAGLPGHVRFAHKTGTQRARTCDAGLISVPRPGNERHVIVVACTRGDLLSARSDRALKDVGAALCKSGLLTDGKPHDPLCLPPSHAVPGPVPDER